MNDELTSPQIDELQAELLRLQRELRELLNASKDESKPVDLGTPIGRLSRMDAMQQQSMAQANRRSHEVRLQQIAAALNLLHTDDYGLCRACEEPIGYPRLNARPESPFCLDCQSAREKRG
jgi:DnaK suppressor protein